MKYLENYQKLVKMFDEDKRNIVHFAILYETYRSSYRKSCNGKQPIGLAILGLQCQTLIGSLVYMGQREGGGGQMCL